MRVEIGSNPHYVWGTIPEIIISIFYTAPGYFLKLDYGFVQS